MATNLLATPGASVKLLTTRTGGILEMGSSMRDKLVHDYMDVDLAIVFDVAIQEIPRLLQNLLKKL